MRKSKQEIAQMEQRKVRITPGFSGQATEISEFPGKAKTEFQIWHPGNGSRNELTIASPSIPLSHTHQIHERPRRRIQSQSRGHESRNDERGQRPAASAVEFNPTKPSPPSTGFQIELGPRGTDNREEFPLHQPPEKRKLFFSPPPESAKATRHAQNENLLHLEP